MTKLLAFSTIDEVEWDEIKERHNIAKHGLDFQTAAKIFLDPYMIEFEDAGNYGESRWNAIGLAKPACYS